MKEDRWDKRTEEEERNQGGTQARLRPMNYEW